MRIKVLLGRHGRLRIVAPDGATWSVPGPMVPTPSVHKPARVIEGPARRTVEWARREK